MAFWSKKVDEFDQTDQVIHQSPGISQAKLADALGVERSTVARRLPSMEEAGFLYYEDDAGGLWPFRGKS